MTRPMAPVVREAEQAREGWSDPAIRAKTRPRADARGAVGRRHDRESGHVNEADDAIVVRLQDGKIVSRREYIDGTCRNLPAPGPRHLKTS